MANKTNTKKGCQQGCIGCAGVLFVLFVIAIIAGPSSEQREQRKAEREQQAAEREQQEQERVQRATQTEQPAVVRIPKYAIISDDDLRQEKREVVVRLEELATEAEISAIADEINKNKRKKTTLLPVSKKISKILKQIPFCCV